MVKGCNCKNGYGNCRKDSKLIGKSIMELDDNKHKKHLKKVLNMSPQEIHAIKSTARHILGEKTIYHKELKGSGFLDDFIDTLGRGVSAVAPILPHLLGGKFNETHIKDLAEVKDSNDLADMVEQDHKLEGGDFLDTLGDIGKIAGTILPFIL
jgi:hypothetical protein